jgi:hypothetical protein
LNVSTAGAVVLYEAARQARCKKKGIKSPVVPGNASASKPKQQRGLGS